MLMWHGEWVMLWVAAMYKCSCYTEHGLSCLYAETVECMSSGGSVWYVGVEVML